jgi:site-specific DNA recombinase
VSEKRAPFISGPVRVATYTRISTDEEHQPFSLEAQALRLGSYIESQDSWQLVHRFTDQMSGSTLERPGLQQALAYARAKRYDMLLVYRVDRLCRSVRGLAQILEELDHAGASFRSATEPFDTATAAGRMMVQMLGVFAEFERATLIDRVIAGMERKAARGEWLGGHAPYGYRLNRDTALLEPNESEAPIARLIFDLYTKKRLGARGVANYLSHHGYRSRPGQLWSHVSVLNVLRNPAYVGKIAFRDTHYDSPHAALVDAETFAKAQRLLRQRGEDASTRRSNTTDFLLSGLVVCAACGRRYIGTAAHGRNARYRYYTCFSRNRHGRQGCRSDVVRADLLDQAVLESLLATYADTEVVSAAIERWCSRAAKQGPDSASQVRRLEAEISGTESAVQRYYNAFENGRLPDTRFASRVDALERRLTELRAKLEELRDSAKSIQAPSKESVRDAEEAVRDAMLNGTPGQRKALLKELIVEVRVESRDSIIPTFRLPATSVRVTEAMVGRGGLEPPVSAVIRTERCASRSGRPSVRRGRYVARVGGIVGSSRQRPAASFVGAKSCQRSGCRSSPPRWRVGSKEPVHKLRRRRIRKR